MIGLDVSLRRGLGAMAFAMGVLSPCAAFAHVFPKTQSPPAGAEVSAPASVTIVFDGPLEPSFSSLTVTDPSGKTVNTAKAEVSHDDTKTISVALPPLGPARYTVHWVAVASDGHRTHGDYSFTVK